MGLDPYPQGSAKRQPPIVFDYDHQPRKPSLMCFQQWHLDFLNHISATEGTENVVQTYLMRNYVEINLFSKIKIIQIRNS